MIGRRLFDVLTMERSTVHAKGSNRRYVPGPSSPPSTVVLLGTGAVEHSWSPVRNALLSIHPLVPVGEENLAFADIVYDLRHRANIAGRWRFGLPGMSTGMKRALGTMLERYRDLPPQSFENLLRLLLRGLLSVRPFVSELGRRLTESDYVVLTTNWDFVLETEFVDRPVLHIYGDIDDGEGLYLPAEMAWEPYRELKWHAIYTGTSPPRPWQLWRRRLVRYPDLWSTLSKANWILSRVDRIIVGGLSFSPLDAELGGLIKSAVDGGRRRVRELIVIDPESQPVAQRIQYHARGAIEHIRCIAPEAAASL